MDGFALRLELGNAVMETADDVADALRVVAGQVARGAVQGAILDGNGNTVGRFEFTDTDNDSGKG